MLSPSESGRAPRGSAVSSASPASEWALGHPVGNGRVGAMALGRVTNERITLNHDLLWRRFLAWQDHNAAPLLPEVRRLCAEGRWDEAQDLFLTRIPETGHAIYINPYVPFCDLGLFLKHIGGEEASGYVRTLDMDAGMARVDYEIDRRRYRREMFCCFETGLFFLRLTCSVAGCLCGEVSLSRLLDPECAVTGASSLGSLALEGEFEEGVRFAAKARVFQRGGRLTGGIRGYITPAGEMPGKNISGIEFIFRDESVEFRPCGVTTCFDSADEVVVAVALATDDEGALPPLELCDRKLAAAGGGFPDVPALLAAHSAIHRRFYRRAEISLGFGDDAAYAEKLLEDVAAGKPADPSLYGRLFNMGRYLSIASGMPQGAGAAPKSPINLQGIWNEDRRPAWDCDFHLDLNVEMCYWGLDVLNLGELMRPLLEWALRLMPQGRRAAMDLYGCRGVCYPATCDNKALGTPDNIGYCFTSAAAWVAQILWAHYEYSLDIPFLKDLYPYLRAVAEFYDDFLREDALGRLVACPSGSPEMGIAGRDRWSVLSSMAAIDMELVREVYEHLCEASAVLGVDGDRTGGWRRTLEKLPLPPITADGCLGEWLEPHEPYDPGHRHRSHFVGLLPGSRITVEDTPEYAAAARRALERRHCIGLESALSLTTVMDAAIAARLYDADEALRQLDATLYYNVMENLLMGLYDWRGRGGTLVWFGGHRLFQIEAGIGMAGAIADLVMHDRRGVIRLLPALPGAWPNGEAFGLMARRGFEVSMEWEGGVLRRARVFSTLGGECRVIAFHSPSGARVRTRGKEIARGAQGQMISFDTGIGEYYTVEPM